MFLTFDICEIELKLTLLCKKLCSSIDDGRLHELQTIQVADDLIDVAGTIDIEVVHHSSLPHVSLWHDKSFESQLSSLDGDGQRAFDGLQGAVQAQLANHHVTVQHVCVHLPARGKNAYRHRQVEARTFLPDIGWRHVDGNGMTREGVAAVLYRCKDALVTLFDSAVGQAHKSKPGTASRIDFNSNFCGLKALNAGTECLN